MQCRLLAVPLLVPLLGLAGCGGPGKGTFVKNADERCRNANAPVASVKTPTSYPELAEAAKGVGAATDTQVRELRELDRPGSDKQRIDAVFAALGGVAPAAKSLQGAAEKTDDKASARAANDLSARAREAGDGARAYGFTACGISTQAAATPLFDGAKTIVKAGFLAKAEGICRAASRKIDNVAEPRGRNVEVRALDALLPIAEELMADLRGLAFPPGDEASLTDLYDGQQKLVDELGRLRDAYRANDARRVEAITEEGDVLSTAVDAKWDAYGVRACGTDF